MAITLGDIRALENGARFFNADLHVHSFGGSHDVKDPSLTIDAIVNAAVKHGISVLAITDHNTAKHVEMALERATKHPHRLLVLPAAELTTANGHLLVYFDPGHVADLHTLLGKIGIKNQGTPEAHTTMSMTDVIKETDSLGGICIAAHIDREKTGLERTIRGYPNAKQDVICSRGLYGLECDDVAHLVWYSLDDDATHDAAERRKLCEARSKAQNTSSRASLARLQGSDAHTLSDFIARNSGRTTTRFKMTDLSFAAFKTALVDPDARVRAVATIPRSVPRVIGMYFTGGFLDGEKYHLSDNLNCFIGGRGTGKSTALQCLAYALGLRHDMAARDDCPDCVVVYCEDENGVLYRYERLRGSEPVVKAKEDQSIQEVPTDAFRVEFYGQGELAEVSKDPLKNPTLLQDFLDRHITLRDQVEHEDALLKALAQNSAQLIPLEAAFGQLQAKRKTSQEIDQKLKIAEEGKLKEVVGRQAQLTAEKNLRDSLTEVAAFYSAGLTLSNFQRDYDALKQAVGPTTEKQQSLDCLKRLEDMIGSTNTYLEQKEREINVRLTQSSADMEKALSDLGTIHTDIEIELNEKIKELQAKGLTGSIAELQTLLKQRTAIVKSVADITSKQSQLLRLRIDRGQYLEQLRKVREEIMARRKAQLRDINRNLARTLKDYTVFVHYDPAGITDSFLGELLDTMEGSYFPEETARRVAADTSPGRLAELVAAKRTTEVASIGKMGIEWATEICSRFQVLTKLHALQVLWKSPCPRISVRTKSTTPKDIPVNQLSDGQKHTILLTIAMFAKSNLPLVMDQPEDDLDNAFIFSSVVSTLRAIKERRQVILVTHNANIAVLGDSELILPMKREGDKGTAFEKGAIDRASTKKAAQDIMEGGRAAFQRRMEIYGH